MNWLFICVWCPIFHTTYKINYIKAYNTYNPFCIIFLCLWMSCKGEKEKKRKPAKREMCLIKNTCKRDPRKIKLSCRPINRYDLNHPIKRLHLDIAFNPQPWFWNSKARADQMSARFVRHSITDASNRGYLKVIRNKFWYRKKYMLFIINLCQC